jgi:serine/threonine protein kinase
MAERLSDFSFQKLGEARIWVDRRLSQKAFIEAMADPDRLFDRPDCQVVKDERKIKVARVKLATGGVTSGVYIKRYNAFSRGYRIASIFRRSRAVRSLLGAMILTRAGVSVGRPLAAVEARRWAMLAKSFFLTEEILCGKTADNYWREELKPLTGSGGFKRRRKFLAALAALFRQLHSRRIYHNDLKDANILVKGNPNGGESLYLLDLEGVRACCYLSRRRRLKNIVQLNRTLGRFLSKTEKLYLLRQYFSDAIDEREVRSWIASLLPMSERAERRSALKQPPAGGCRN